MAETTQVFLTGLNVVVLVGLAIITWKYASSTKDIADATRRQADTSLEMAKATKEQADASVKMAEEMREQRLETSRPMVIQKAVHEAKLKLGANPPLGEAYFHHFLLVNVGNGPALDVEVSLRDENRNQICLDKETFLRANEEFVPFSKRYTAQDLKDFGPEGMTVAEMKDEVQGMNAQARLTRKDSWFNKAALEESKQYYLVCEYQDIFDGRHRTQLPFKISKAEEPGEIYVASAKMQLTL